MTWTAPNVNRQDWPRLASERVLLEELLDWHRSTLLVKCAGLSAGELKRRAVASSELSLLGLVRHLIDSERHWFWDFAGVTDWSFVGFEGTSEADAAADLALYAEVCTGSRDLVAANSLDDSLLRDGETHSLRWIYLHMIEEYARHNGHADLLREGIDGSTGE